MATFSEHLSAANAMLAKLRGNAESPSKVLADARAAGCQMVADGDNLRITGPLTDDLRQRVKQCKPAIIRLLAEAPVKPAHEFDFWNAEEASDTVKLLLARFEDQGWPESKDMSQEAGRCMDAIDDALREQNLAAFKRAIHRFIDFMDEQFPRRIGKEVWFEPPKTTSEPTYSAWVRKSGTKPWLRIASGCPDKSGLEEKIHEYTKNVYQADVLILADGEDPNTRKATK